MHSFQAFGFRYCEKVLVKKFSEQNQTIVDDIHLLEKNTFNNYNNIMPKDDDLFISGPRDYNEQTDSFRFDLENLIYRYIDEYDINTITIIGALQEKVVELSNEGNEDFESDIELQ